jgi:hypothetical protein
MSTPIQTSVYCSTSQSKGAYLLDLLPLGGTIEVKRALCAYFLTFILVAIILYVKVRIRLFSSIVIALVVGQIVLNMVFVPHNLSFWAEFDSMIGIYGVCQVLTPIIVVIYVFIVAFSDKRGRVCGSPSYSSSRPQSLRAATVNFEPISGLSEM